MSNCKLHFGMKQPLNMLIVNQHTLVSGNCKKTPPLVHGDFGKQRKKMTIL